MELKIHQQYYNVLDEIIKMGSKRSPTKPWPNPNIAVMCIYGWIKRIDDRVVITDNGRYMYNNAEVHR
jgi:hypothetical protein